MILQKIRAFFEWLGKRSTAKSRKALDYEWTTMRPEGEAPVKTVDLGDSVPAERPVPVKTVDVTESKPVQTHTDSVSTAKTEATAVKPEVVDVERRMAEVLKTLTIRDAIEALKVKFTAAGSVRRSRVALLAFLRDTDGALQCLEEAAGARTPAKKSAAKKPATKKTTAKRTPAKKPVKAASETAAPVQPQEAKPETAPVKATAAKKTAVR